MYISAAKKIRYGYKLYQKIFKRYRAGQNFRINVRKPRLAVKRKTVFGKALEIKEKFSYLLGGMHASKLRRYCRLSISKFFSPAVSFINFLESRLDILLYRSNLLGNPKFARFCITAGFVSVNGKTIVNPAFRVSLNSTIDISLPVYAYSSFFSFFKSSITKNLVFKPEPRYLSISHRLFRIIMHSRAELADIFYPFNFNINYFYRLYSI